MLSFESSAARVSLEGRLEEAELARSGIEEADMARASLEARLVEADEAKAELVARLGVSEEAKSELVARLEETSMVEVSLEARLGDEGTARTSLESKLEDASTAESSSLRVFESLSLRVFELQRRQLQRFESSVSRGGLKKSATVSSQRHCLSLREYEEEDMKAIVWGLFEAQLFQVIVIVWGYIWNVMNGMEWNGMNGMS